MELDKKLEAFLEEIYFIKDVVEEVLNLPEITDSGKKMKITRDFPEEARINGDPRLLKISQEPGQ